MKQLRKKEIKKLFKEVKRDKEIYVILENIQYARNVASIFRTLDAGGVRRLYLTGISQQPPFGKELKKTSRNKERSVEWMYEEDTGRVINTLKKLGFVIIAVELTDNSKSISELPQLISKDSKVCFIFGSEVFGVKKTTLEKVDMAIHIPMYGRGASLNVSTTVGIILYGF
jgi:tRNA G18 (ribose-2'-O)-methylase SpoU